jgi:hypothetical protein
MIKYNRTTYAHSNHNALENLQGGTPDYRGHITEEQHAFINEKMVGVPSTPINLYPADGELDVYQIPIFAVSSYSSPTYTPLAKINVIIATDPETANKVFWDDVFTSSTTFEVQPFLDLIQPNTTYYWQVRFEDENGLRGSYSTLTSFTTLAEFQSTVVKTPEITYPSKDGLRIPTINPSFISSPFAIHGMPDSHESSDWQLAAAATFASENIIAETTDDITNLTSWQPPVSIMNTVYVRTRYKGAQTPGKSPWSPRRMALPREYYTDSLIGVGFRLLSNGSLVGHNIDEAGNDVSIAGNYFDNNSIFQHPLNIIADQHMVIQVPVYVKCQANKNAAVGEDVYRYWVSPGEFEGSYLHPAFAQSEGAIYWGKYFSGNDVADTSLLTQGNSKPDYYPKRGTISRTERWTYADYLNTAVDAAHKGWDTMSIYDKCLLNLLMVVEYKTFKLSTYLDGTVAFNTVLNSDASRPVWRNITNAYSLGPSDANRASETAQGFYMSPLFNTLYRISLPEELIHPVEIQSSFTATQTAGIDVGSFMTGWNDLLGCDLDLLFLPDSAGTTTGIYAAAKRDQSTEIGNALNMLAFSDIYSSNIKRSTGVACFCSSGGINNPGLISRLVKRTKS